MADKNVKIGVRQGGGPPPGYKWSVEYLTLAENEFHKILGEDHQRKHVIAQVRRLAQHDDPTHPSGLRVTKLGDVYELKEKGGPLGKINLRVFFFLEQNSRSIVLLGNYKKEEDGSIPPAILLTMGRRRRKYLNGDYGAAD